MKQPELEKIVLKTAGDVCACLYEHGYEKCRNGDPSWNQLAEHLRELNLLEIESLEQQINNQINSIAINFCMKNYNGVGRHIRQLNKLGIPPELIKSSELYKLASECVVQDFNQERAALNYGNAMNIVEIAKNLGIKIPEETERLYKNLGSALDSSH